jgi:hypothetical protein
MQEHGNFFVTPSPIPTAAESGDIKIDNLPDNISLEEMQVKMYRDAMNILYRQMQGDTTIPESTIARAKDLTKIKPKSIAEEEQQTETSKVLQLILDPKAFQERFTYR